MELKKKPGVDLDRFKDLFLLAGFVITIVIVLAAFEWKTPNEGKIELLTMQNEEIEEEIIPIIREEAQQEKPPPPPQVQTDIFEEVDDEEEIEDEMVIVDEVVEEDTEIEVVEVEEEEEEETVFFVVEDMPIFKYHKKRCNTEEKGKMELMKWIAQNVKYPNIARENDIQGRVYVRFAVTKTGKVEKVSLARGVDPILDKEALRVVKLLPAWKPGMQRGKAVSVWYTVPITFTLQ